MTVVTAPAGAGTRERRDLAAWWAMGVACQMEGGCDRPAAWQSVPPCGCRAFVCGPHREEWMQRYRSALAKGLRFHCTDHEVPLPDPFPWRPL